MTKKLHVVDLTDDEHRALLDPTRHGLGPPPGRATWTMRLLADKLVEVGAVEAIFDETVRRTLKTTTSSPGNGSSGASPR